MTIAVETETRRDKSRRLAAYGVGDFGLNIYWNTLTLFLVFFYTVVVGLDPKVAGLIYFIGMAWDAVSDPVVAGLAERVRTPRGTYLPFLFYGSPLLAPIRGQGTYPRSYRGGLAVPHGLHTRRDPICCPVRPRDL